MFALMKKLSLLFTALVLLVAVNNKAAVAAEWYSGIYVAPKLSYNYVVMDPLRVDVAGFTIAAQGYDFSKGENDDSFGLALAIGYDFDKRLGIPVRTELEYSYLGRASGSAARQQIPSPGHALNSGYNQKMDIQTVFLNAYFDIKTGTPFTPYVGGGLGFAMIDVEKAGLEETLYYPGGSMASSLSPGSKTHTNFAWNIGAGLGWDITPAITLDLGYRYMMLGEAKSKWLDVTGGAGALSFRTKVDDVNIHQVSLPFGIPSSYTCFCS